MTNARTARARRSAAQTEKPRDIRQPRRLPMTGAAGNMVQQLVTQAIQQATSSDVARIGLATYVEGAGLQGEWRLRLKGLSIGEAWLVPVRLEDEPEEPKSPTTPEPVPGKPVAKPAAKPRLVKLREKAAGA